MPLEWKDHLTDQLCDALLTLKTSEEAYCFLEDVATIAEIKALAQRLQVAFMLMDGASYPQIAERTGASTATISRVKKTVDYGADGYQIIRSRISKE
ncbi:MAG: helix-turn-helix domain-containing protein [Synergistaceae bacterium]|jgi:TrpR-related protein YerC/YecD|nr:helix-turn-helix domain-containing protein [Synergistaceae bacterium]MBP9957702.1 helix-turn-helix domain-containing protein [Synergistaceae bacterium]